MKNLRVSLAVAAALGTSAAGAAVVSEYANGVLVPQATFESADVGTAVGLNTCAAGRVFWTFFDEDSTHITDGQFDMTANDQFSYIWADQSGVGLQGQDGYLVFVLDTNGNQALDTSDAACLSGNAFFVDIPNNDVAFVPTLPLNTENVSEDDVVGVLGDFGDSDDGGIFVPDLTTMGPDSIVALGAGANSGDLLHMRYFIDGQTGGRDTALVFWSAQDVRGRFTVNIFDDEQNRKSVNFELDNAELNIVNPETIVGRPFNFLDGFIQWDLSGSEYRATTGEDTNDTGTVPDGVFSYSVISDPGFGAVQTVINPVRLRDLNGNDQVRVRADRTETE